MNRRRCAWATWKRSHGSRPGTVTGELPPLALQLYWTLYTGVLVFWANDKSPKQEDTLALLDHSLNMFVGWLREPARSRGNHRQNDKESRHAIGRRIDEMRLPESEESPTSEPKESRPTWPAEMSLRPVPVGRLRRLGLLGTLQAKIGAAYLFHWLRGWFKNADENERLLAETHWRTALRVLDSMSYLRGATMKVGQTLANFPDIVPAGSSSRRSSSCTSTRRRCTGRCLSEMVHNELGDDPENLFASFDKRAFAAASLGQVHRAGLETGEEVAVKIQYPGIARTIREDFRNLLLFMLPARLSRDWENTKEQFDDLRIRLERETDYEQEAAMLAKARALFREDDGIVVPACIPRVSRRPAC